MSSSGQLSWPTGENPLDVWQTVVLGAFLRAFRFQQVASYRVRAFVRS